MIQTERQIQTSRLWPLPTLIARVNFLSSRRYRFHLILATIFLLMLTFSAVGTYFTHIKTDGTGSLALALALLIIAISPLPVYWQQNGDTARRDSIFVIYWTMLFAFVIRYPVLVAARMGFPLRDSLFTRIDQALFFDVPDLMRWVSGYPWLHASLNYSYSSLPFVFVIAVILPVWSGRNGDNAQRFIVANASAFLISVPVFVLLPAIGPWVGYHFQPIEPQRTCGATILALRSAGDYFYKDGDVGIVCFPSFHAIWGIMAAYGLWGFRTLRIPAMLLSILIVISTMSTGWHYFADVLAGTVVALVSIVVAGVLLPGKPTEGQAQSTVLSDLSPPSSI